MATKGKIQIEIQAKDTASTQMAKIGKSADAMSKKFKTMGKVMIGVGMALAAALGAAVVSYAKAGDEVAKMAKRTGLAAEMLSELRHVAGLTGTDLSSVEKAAKRMSKTIVDASEGMATYIRAFDRIGLSAEMLMRLSPEEQFWTIAKAIGGLGDATIRAATAQDIFGRAGTQLLPMMAESAEALDAMRQEAHKLGVVFDEEAAKKAEALQDALLKLKESLKGVGFVLADTLVPIITDFLENKVIPTITKIIDWIALNEDLAKKLGIVAGILVAGGALMLGLGMVSKAIIAINAALIVMHGLMGPAGWAKLAIGLGIAAGAIYGMGKLLEPPQMPEGLEVPEMQKGGIVKRPTLAFLGERGPEAVIPLAGGAGRVVNYSPTFNFPIENFMGDESSQRALVRKFKEIMGQDVRRTSFAGINRLEYFPGSSAP